MEGMREIYDDVPCSSRAVESTVRIGTAGAIWGLFIGPYDARKNGLTGVARASFVLKSVGKMGFQSGLFAGLYSSTHCGIERYRRKKDMLNASIAGAVAGAAIAARTRSWPQIIGMATMLSAITSAADILTAN